MAGWLSRKTVLSFDCYGTLIDWETGLTQSLRSVATRHAVPFDHEEWLTSFARAEAHNETGPYRHYREVLSDSLRDMGRALQFQPTESECREFADSVQDWEPFADSRRALERLRSKYRLAVITNCDDDLFASANRKLGNLFSWVITAEQVRGYKPSHTPFHVALAQMNVSKSEVLHIAQSLFHDLEPAAQLGIDGVWINRRAGRPGGATPASSFRPDHEFANLDQLTDWLLDVENENSVSCVAL